MSSGPSSTWDSTSESEPLRDGSREPTPLGASGPHPPPSGADRSDRRRSRRRPADSPLIFPGTAGFTLIEVLVALAILSLLLLSALTLAAVEQRSQRRLAAHAEAERVLEVAYERLRAGALPLSPGPLDVPFAAPDGVVVLDVEATPTLSLYRIRLAARYRSGGERERSLEGLLWRP
ncbi:MAG: prepilin-type N-terminal cleavage/methylation domain-containing protein [Acidobacteria bacterium]|nr:prepilin-type N-terminal cleavage/methylation domain-containing protein [Acidobacteriota bacterium]MCB9377534.1 prepilin-type N-terminal cleavage/methylation domain-containing protein [Holophagales bacterium]